MVTASQLFATASFPAHAIIAVAVFFILHALNYIMSEPIECTSTPTSKDGVTSELANLKNQLDKYKNKWLYQESDELFNILGIHPNSSKRNILRDELSKIGFWSTVCRYYSISMSNIGNTSVEHCDFVFANSWESPFIVKESSMGPRSLENTFISIGGYSDDEE